MIYDNILGTIGRTPIVKINRLAPAGTTMYVKCEFFNPLSSVKDRLAIAIIEDAERSGTLKPGQTVVEATSGNTGIALAMVCAAKGYPFVAVMVETFSIERRKIMRMLGAKVILTPAAGRGQGMVRKAAELAQKHGWFLARQFENQANPGLSPQHHGSGNPPGLRRQAARSFRHRLGHGRHAHRRGPDDQTGAPRHQDHRRPNPRPRSCWAASRFAPHKIQGWTPDFLPAVLNRNVRRPHRPGDRRRSHRICARPGEERRHFRAASRAARRSPRRSRWHAKRATGSVTLAMLPDTGERYLSTPLFEGINDGGDPEP